MKIRSRLEAGAARASRVLIARACRPLPDAERDERYQEWVAELPAIPECHRFWPGGLLAMLLFAADQFRTTRPARRLARPVAKPRHRRPGSRPSALSTLTSSLAEVGEAVADIRHGGGVRVISGVGIGSGIVGIVSGLGIAYSVVLVYGVVCVVLGGYIVRARMARMRKEGALGTEAESCEAPVKGVS